MCMFPDWLPTVMWWWTFSQNPQLFREKLSIPHLFIFFSSTSSCLYDFHSLVIVKEFWPTFLCIIESGLWGLWSFAMHSSLNKITNVLLSIPIRLRSGIWLLQHLNSLDQALFFGFTLNSRTLWNTEKLLVGSFTVRCSGPVLQNRPKSSHLHHHADSRYVASVLMCSVWFSLKCCLVHYGQTFTLWSHLWTKFQKSWFLISWFVQMRKIPKQNIKREDVFPWEVFFLFELF